MLYLNDVMMLHPYHSYVVLFDTDFHTTIEKLLRENLAVRTHHYNRLKADIEYLERKKKVTEDHLFQLQVAERLFLESQSTFDQWSNKQIVRITENQKETLFENKK